MYQDQTTHAAVVRISANAHLEAEACAVNETSACTSQIRFNTSVGPISAYVSVPETRIARPPLLALHGISRDAKSVFDAFRKAPKNAERVIIAPLFDARKWPVYQRITHRNRADIAWFCRKVFAWQKSSLTWTQLCCEGSKLLECGDAGLA